MLREEYAQTSQHSVHPLTLTETPGITEDKSEIVRIWASLLDSDNIGDHDDFFALGGDSLSATSMLVAVATLFGLALPLSAEAFINNPTVTGVMRMLADGEEVETAGENRGIAYPMRKGGGLGTLFFVPANQTKGLYLRRMTRYLADDWASYLLRPSELAPFRPLYSIEDAARHVVKALKYVQPEGPYVIGGYCQGGIIAFEAGLVLERAGESVSLILFDTPFPGGASVVRQWQMYSTNARDKVMAATRGGTFKPALRSARSMSRKSDLARPSQAASRPRPDFGALLPSALCVRGRHRRISISTVLAKAECPSSTSWRKMKHLGCSERRCLGGARIRLGKLVICRSREIITVSFMR